MRRVRTEEDSDLESLGQLIADQRAEIAKLQTWLVMLSQRLAKLERDGV